MTYADLAIGIYYPDEGFDSLVKSMTKVCIELGVEIKLNESVQKIEVVNGVATSVDTDKGHYSSDFVVGAADYHHIETKLISKEYNSYTEEYWSERKLGPATFCIYLGINKKLKNLEHHNYYFSEGWNDHFNKIFNQPGWPEDPSIYISCPSKTDPNVAPDGMENIFMLIPLAAGLDDNTDMREKLFDISLNILRKITGEDIMSDSIIIKEIVAQNDHKKMYNAYQGNALGLAHTFFQTGFFRPRMSNKKIKNMFYTGQYTQPGTSTVMTTISGELVTNEIIKNDRDKI